MQATVNMETGEITLVPEDVMEMSGLEAFKEAGGKVKMVKSMSEDKRTYIYKLQHVTRQ